MSDLHAVDPELSIRTAYAHEDFTTAARLAFALYGREILTFLRARLRGEDHADEAFAMFAEDLWSGIQRFEWRCTLRCWAYVLARNAANRYTNAPHRQRVRNLPLSQHASALVREESARARTEPHRDTSVKHRMRALREQLVGDDQTLLMLHIDRGLTFRELALVLHNGEAPLAGEAHARETARLRKRFERVKTELRRLARKEGLLR